MIVIVLAIALLLPVGAVWLALRALRFRCADDSRLVTLAVSISAGMGLSSVVTFWCAVVGIQINQRIAAADALGWLAIGATAAWVLRGRRTAGGQQSRPEAGGPQPDKYAALARVAFWSIAAIAASAVVANYLASPHGEWDAWAIWNQKARFFVRDTPHWTAMLGARSSQAGHPLLLPLSVARLWGYAGSETTLAPAMLEMLWAIGIVAAVMGALGTRRLRAWIAGCVVLAPAVFTQLVAAQTGDLPMALFVVTTLVVLRRALDPDSSVNDMRADLLLTAALGSVAAWMKNEGLVLLALATVIAAWTSLKRGRARDMVWWAAGMTPAFVTLAWFKLIIAPVSPAYIADTGGAAGIMARVFDLGRHALIGRLIAPRWIVWGGPWAAGSLPLVMVAAVVAGFTVAGRSMRPLLAVLAGMLVGYYAVWLVSPIDTPWLVATTFDRLFLQLWPTLVLVAFSAGHRERVEGPAPVAIAAGGRR